MGYWALWTSFAKHFVVIVILDLIDASKLSRDETSDSNKFKLKKAKKYSNYKTNVSLKHSVLFKNNLHITYIVAYTYNTAATTPIHSL